MTTKANASETEGNAAPTRSGGPRVSLTMIVKDEDNNLAACLGPVAGLFDELIVVDTGSTDRTKEIAAGFGAKLVDFPWCDSFAAARNESLRHATGEWAFWLDADDRLDEANCIKLEAILDSLGWDSACYAMWCECPGPWDFFAVCQVRLFRNLPGLRWTHRVHERIPLVEGVAQRPTNVAIRHVGYCDPAMLRQKNQRNLRLAELDFAENPDDLFTHYELGRIYSTLGRAAEALPLLRRCWQLDRQAKRIGQAACLRLADCLGQLGQYLDVLEVCREGLARFPDDVGLLRKLGVAFAELGHLSDAEACFRRLLGPGVTFGSIVVDCRYRYHHCLGVTLCRQGRDDEAQHEFARAVALRPDFLPAHLGLAELFLLSRRWVELERTTAMVEALPGGADEAAVLRHRGALARQQLARLL